MFMKKICSHSANFEKNVFNLSQYSFEYLFQGKEISKEDKFFFNESFSHKLYRIKINQVQLKESVSMLYFVCI